MINFLKLTESPQINFEVYFEIMRDFRKGGLNPDMYEEFIQMVRTLPAIINRTEKDYEIFNKFNLTDLAKEQFPIIASEVLRRNLEKSKMCWHPLAGPDTCKTKPNGEIIISAAHSLQNNGVLSAIAKNGEVTTYARETADLKAATKGKKLSSIFWGFCNTHDAIFSPVETQDYTGTEEQNFLFAYRAFIVAVHKKVEALNSHNFGDQAVNDIQENKKIFDEAILSANYGIIKTEVIDLPYFYPIAAASSFYLDYDYNGKEISHSDERMENIYITLLPLANGSKFLISYLGQDAHLYADIPEQIKARNNWRADLSVLLGHTENIYFEPDYFDAFITPQSQAIMDFMFATQFDYNIFDENNRVLNSISFTPKDIMNNPFELNFFGY